MSQNATADDEKAWGFANARTDFPSFQKTAMGVYSVLETDPVVYDRIRREIVNRDSSVQRNLDKWHI